MATTESLMALGMPGALATNVSKALATAVTDSSGGTASRTIAAATNTNAITDSTGGTPSTSSMANLADGSTYATDHSTIENNFATIAAELAAQRTLNTVLINAVASLADAINDMSAGA